MEGGGREEGGRREGKSLPPKFFEKIAPKEYTKKGPFFQTLPRVLGG